MARHGVEAAPGAAAALPPNIPGWDPQDLNTAPAIEIDTIQHPRAGEDGGQDKTWVHRRMALQKGQKKSPIDETMEIDPLTIYSEEDKVTYDEASDIIEDYSIFERVMKACTCKPSGGDWTGLHQHVMELLKDETRELHFSVDLWKKVASFSLATCMADFSSLRNALTEQVRVDSLEAWLKGDVHLFVLSEQMLALECTKRKIPIRPVIGLEMEYIRFEPRYPDCTSPAVGAATTPAATHPATGEPTPSASDDHDVQSMEVEPERVVENQNLDSPPGLAPPTPPDQPMDDPPTPVDPVPQVQVDPVLPAQVDPVPPAQIDPVPMDTTDDSEAGILSEDMMPENLPGKYRILDPTPKLVSIPGQINGHSIHGVHRRNPPGGWPETTIDQWKQRIGTQAYPMDVSYFQWFVEGYARLQADNHHQDRQLDYGWTVRCYDGFPPKVGRTVETTPYTEKGWEGYHERPDLPEVFIESETLIWSKPPKPIPNEPYVIDRHEWEDCESLLLHLHAKRCEEIGQPLKYWDEVNYRQMAIECHKNIAEIYAPWCAEWEVLRAQRRTDEFGTFYHFLFYKFGFHDWTNVCAMFVKLCLLSESARAVLSRSAMSKKALKQMSHMGDSVVDEFFTFVACASGAHKRPDKVGGDAILNEFYRDIGRLMGLHLTPLCAVDGAPDWSPKHADFIGDVFETIQGIAVDIGYWPLVIFMSVAGTPFKFNTSEKAATYPRRIVTETMYAANEPYPGTHKALMDHWERLNTDQTTRDRKLYETMINHYHYGAYPKVTTLGGTNLTLAREATRWQHLKILNKEATTVSRETKVCLDIPNRDRMRDDQMYREPQYGMLHPYEKIPPDGRPRDQWALPPPPPRGDAPPPKSKVPPPTIEGKAPAPWVIPTAKGGLTFSFGATNVRVPPSLGPATWAKAAHPRPPPRPPSPEIHLTPGITVKQPPPAKATNNDRSWSWSPRQAPEPAPPVAKAAATVPAFAKQRSVHTTEGERAQMRAQDEAMIDDLIQEVSEIQRERTTAKAKASPPVMSPTEFPALNAQYGAAPAPQRNPNERGPSGTWYDNRSNWNQNWNNNNWWNQGYNQRSHSSNSGPNRGNAGENRTRSWAGQPYSLPPRSPPVRPWRSSAQQNHQPQEASPAAIQSQQPSVVARGLTVETEEERSVREAGYTQAEFVHRYKDDFEDVDEVPTRLAAGYVTSGYNRDSHAHQLIMSNKTLRPKRSDLENMTLQERRSSITGEAAYLRTGVPPHSWITNISIRPNEKSQKEWIQAISLETAWCDLAVAEDYMSTKCEDSELADEPLDFALTRMFYRDMGPPANERGGREPVVCRRFLDDAFVGPLNHTTCIHLAGMLHSIAHSKEAIKCYAVLPNYTDVPRWVRTGERMPSVFVGIPPHTLKDVIQFGLPGALHSPRQMLTQFGQMAPTCRIHSELHKALLDPEEIYGDGANVGFKFTKVDTFGVRVAVEIAPRHSAVSTVETANVNPDSHTVDWDTLGGLFRAPSWSVGQPGAPPNKRGPVWNKYWLSQYQKHPMIVNMKHEVGDDQLRFQAELLVHPRLCNYHIVAIHLVPFVIDANPYRAELPAAVGLRPTEQWLDRLTVEEFTLIRWMVKTLRDWTEGHMLPYDTYRDISGLDKLFTGWYWPRVMEELYRYICRARGNRETGRGTCPQGYTPQSWDAEHAWQGSRQQEDNRKRKEQYQNHPHWVDPKEYKSGTSEELTSLLTNFALGLVAENPWNWNFEERNIDITNAAARRELLRELTAHDLDRRLYKYMLRLKEMKKAFNMNELRSGVATGKDPRSINSYRRAEWNENPNENARAPMGANHDSRVKTVIITPCYGELGDTIDLIMSRTLDVVHWHQLRVLHDFAGQGSLFHYIRETGESSWRARPSVSQFRYPEELCLAPGIESVYSFFFMREHHWKSLRNCEPMARQMIDDIEKEACKNTAKFYQVYDQSLDLAPIDHDKVYLVRTMHGIESYKISALEVKNHLRWLRQLKYAMTWRKTRNEEWTREQVYTMLRIFQREGYTMTTLGYNSAQFSQALDSLIDQQYHMLRACTENTGFMNEKVQEYSQGLITGLRETYGNFHEKNVSAGQYAVVKQELMNELISLRPQMADLLVRQTLLEDSYHHAKRYWSQDIKDNNEMTDGIVPPLRQEDTISGQCQKVDFDRCTRHWPKPGAGCDAIRYVEFWDSRLRKLIIEVSIHADMIRLTQRQSSTEHFAETAEHVNTLWMNVINGIRNHNHLSVARETNMYVGNRTTIPVTRSGEYISTLAKDMEPNKLPERSFIAGTHERNFGANNVALRSQELRQQYEQVGRSVRRRSVSRPRERNIAEDRDNHHNSEVVEFMRPILRNIGCESPGHLLRDCDYGPNRIGREMDGNMKQRRAARCIHTTFKWPPSLIFDPFYFQQPQMSKWMNRQHNDKYWNTWFSKFCNCPLETQWRDVMAKECPDTPYVERIPGPRSTSEQNTTISHDTVRTLSMHTPRYLAGDNNPSKTALHHAEDLADELGGEMLTTSLTGWTKQEKKEEISRVRRMMYIVAHAIDVICKDEELLLPIRQEIDYLESDPAKVKSKYLYLSEMQRLEPIISIYQFMSIANEAQYDRLEKLVWKHLPMPMTHRYFRGLSEDDSENQGQYWQDQLAMDRTSERSIDGRFPQCDSFGGIPRLGNKPRHYGNTWVYIASLQQLRHDQLATRGPIRRIMYDLPTPLCGLVDREQTDECRQFCKRTTTNWDTGSIQTNPPSAFEARRHIAEASAQMAGPFRTLEFPEKSSSEVNTFKYVRELFWNERLSKLFCGWTAGTNTLSDMQTVMRHIEVKVSGAMWFEDRNSQRYKNWDQMVKKYEKKELTVADIMRFIEAEPKTAEFYACCLPASSVASDPDDLGSILTPQDLIPEHFQNPSFAHALNDRAPLYHPGDRRVSQEDFLGLASLMYQDRNGYAEQLQAHEWLLDLWREISKEGVEAKKPTVPSLVPTKDDTGFRKEQILEQWYWFQVDENGVPSPHVEVSTEGTTSPVRDVPQDETMPQSQTPEPASEPPPATEPPPRPLGRPARLGPPPVWSSEKIHDSEAMSDQADMLDMCIDVVVQGTPTRIRYSTYCLVAELIGEEPYDSKKSWRTTVAKWTEKHVRRQSELAKDREAYAAGASSLRSRITMKIFENIETMANAIRATLYKLPTFRMAEALRYSSWLERYYSPQVGGIDLGLWKKDAAILSPAMGWMAGTYGLKRDHMFALLESLSGNYLSGMLATSPPAVVHIPHHPSYVCVGRAHQSRSRYFNVLSQELSKLVMLNRMCHYAKAPASEGKSHMPRTESQNLITQALAAATAWLLEDYERKVEKLRRRYSGGLNRLPNDEEHFGTALSGNTAIMQHHVFREALLKSGQPTHLRFDTAHYRLTVPIAHTRSHSEEAMPSARQLMNCDITRLVGIRDDVVRCFHDQDFDLEVFEAPTRRDIESKVEIAETVLERHQQAGLRRVPVEYLDFQVMFIDEYGYYGNVSNLRERYLQNVMRSRYKMNIFHIKNGYDDPVNLTIRRTLGVSHQLYRGLITHYTFGLRRSELPRQSILQEQNESRTQHATVLRGSLARENHFDDERGMTRMISYPGVEDDDPDNDIDVAMEATLYRQFIISYLDRMRAQPENERSTDYHAMLSWENAINETNVIRNRTEHVPVTQGGPALLNANNAAGNLLQVLLAVAPQS